METASVVAKPGVELKRCPFRQGDKPEAPERGAMATTLGVSAAMSASPDALEAMLLKKIDQYLDTYVFENAMFLAERLVAHNRTEENIYLLATCYYRAGHASRAIAVLEKTRRAANRYLLAICCFQQRRWAEAESALLGVENAHLSDPATRENIPNGAAGHYLMGRICRQANRRQQAIECFVKSLEMDPFLWAAYDELCELGADVEAEKFFGDSTYFTEDARGHDEFLNQNEDLDNNNNNNSHFISHQHHPAFGNETPVIGPAFTPQPPPERSEPSDFVTPGSAPRQSVHTTPIQSTYRTPGSATSAEVLKKPRVMPAGAPVNPRTRKALRRPLIENDDKHRRNARLSFSSAISEETTPVAPSSKSPIDSPFTPVATRLFHTKDSPEQPHESSTKSVAVDTYAHQSITGQHELLRLLSSFGVIMNHMSAFKCQEALELLERLPQSQLTSGWAQHQIGRAYFEMADYNQAHEVFRAMHREEPHRMAGLDLYSTTLWHLKKEVELSYLAQQVTDFDRLSPEAWCVAGNCFSLQKEHDTALAFFQRAIQLNPAFTYAYTLSGHEYVANEDFEKAINCYRHAIRTDARHYNAWYGLGTIYYRQEKFEFAEYHFKRALEINPRSSLLHCFLGMVLHSLRKYDEALHVLAIAGELQPLNPQARFQRANVLITMHRLDEALGELKIVRNFAPRESSVHFMMGKVAKKLGRLDEAMRRPSTKSMSQTWMKTIGFNPATLLLRLTALVFEAWCRTRQLLEELNEFAKAPAALTALFTPPYDDQWLAVILRLLELHTPTASLPLTAFVNDDTARGSPSLRSDMVLLAMGKSVLLFATSIYDEELALAIWEGLVHLYERHPTFDLLRQVLDNAHDSHGLSPLHYAVEADMDEFVGCVLSYFSQRSELLERAREVLRRITTQDVVLPVSKAQIQGKNIASGGCTLLHFAAKRGKLQLAEQLVAAPWSMDVAQPNWDGHSALMVAALAGHTETQQLLQRATSEPSPRPEDLPALTAERDERAKVRYTASLNASEAMSKPLVFTSIWETSECVQVLATLEAVTSTRGWDKQRHASYPTTDIPCYCVVPIDAWVRGTIRARLFPQIQRHYGIPTTQQLTFRELFYVKYEARAGERAELPLHCDGSVLSFNILLNPKDEFEGGGTFFEATSTTVHLTQGNAAVHSGKVRHAGAPVVRGKRLILVGFLDIIDRVFDDAILR
ncbi:TPA: hypothetical protein N0F65_001793 [Lagenidium giganteum]|uniref:Fe2OG dioxygenase domain-containing protein n=1 Tax=Lagenidium giganteum TaxID=4803 RepID=A0AAV2Z1N6_9STRA|nr:TPA: hypothetical protein N0F65_001793 [Lagenidium giganteum]